MINARPFEFSERVRKIIISIADAFIDTPADLTITNKNDELIERCQKLIRQFPYTMRVGFILGILLFDRLTFAFGYGLRRFAKLDLAEQRDYVDRWMNSPSHGLRNLITGLRGFVMVTFFSHRDVWNTSSMNLSPTPMAKSHCDRVCFTSPIPITEWMYDLQV